ncbi:MAG: ABC transporter substrate-binding protein [Alphaproteobacteria bacterium]|nr:ABC transporter substrate-binding protein [Alphaproteobacteria bacterium]
MRDFLKVYGPIVLLIVAGFVLTFRFVQPLPPSTIRMAAGAAGGAYAAAAQRYREILARDGITLEIVETKGAVENLKLLAAKDGGIDVALVQGGIGTAEAPEAIVSVASIFFEPIWVFVRGQRPTWRVAELVGRRIAIGPEGSGTRTAALQLLAANAIDSRNADLREIGGADAAAALREGSIDAAFFVSAKPSEAMLSLLRVPNVALLNFERAEAYREHFPFLSSVSVAAGSISLREDLPRRDVTLLAPAAAMLVRDDLHSALVRLLSSTVAEAHGGRQKFSPPGAFPSARHLDFPLHDVAKRYLESGPSFLYRYLPFIVAIWIERLFILIVPLLTLLLPLLRIGPPIYEWQVKRKIYRWYKQLRRIEADASAATDGEARAKLARELDDIDARIRQVSVPLSHMGSLYHLRLHLQFVRNELL